MPMHASSAISRKRVMCSLLGAGSGPQWILTPQNRGERIGKTSPLFAKRADTGRDVKSGAGEREAPRREIAARLMGLDEVRFFYDQLFIKEPGTQAPTAWHNDLPFWPFAGNHVASVWLALTPVTQEHRGLIYVGGSHKWNKLFRPEPAAPIANFQTEESAAFLWR